MIDGSGSGKNDVLLNVMKHQGPHVDEIYLHVKNSFVSKNQLLISGREKVGIKHGKNASIY